MKATIAIVIVIVIVILIILISGCSTIGAYTESKLETQVSFYLKSAGSYRYLKTSTALKVAKTGLVSGNTLLYSANGNKPLSFAENKQNNVVFPLWVNESEVAEVEYAIDKYRQWQAQQTPVTYTQTQPVAEYVSQWMQGVTFKFGLINGENGQPYMRICYQFRELGRCTFTYLIDGQSLDFLSDDLQRLKQPFIIEES